MTAGWVYLTVDGKPAMFRTCYVRAWRDPAWRPRRCVECSESEQDSIHHDPGQMAHHPFRPLPAPEADR